MKKAETDLWEKLAATEKPIVLYGMGNGAEKILSVLCARNIPVRGVFASDGFVSHKSFCGMEVSSFAELKDRYGPDMIALLAFGSARQEVLDTIRGVANACTLYAPDLPPFGDTLFDKAFYNAHLPELEAARGLLCDDLSRDIFDRVISYKLSGEIAPLLAAASDPLGDLDAFLPHRPARCVDLGAYDGDTARELCDLREGTGELCIYAVEPDPKNFEKLSRYAETETRATIKPICACVWSERAKLAFDASHNRNASVAAARSAALSGRPPKTQEVDALPLDELLPAGTAVDYIKFDVEGAEREALLGADITIRQSAPTLAVSLYHRSEDLFALPLLIKARHPAYNRFYLRRRRGVPAWDLTLFVKKEKGN